MFRLTNALSGFEVKSGRQIIFRHAHDRPSKWVNDNRGIIDNSKPAQESIIYLRGIS